jgi:hypothetical protein
MWDLRTDEQYGILKPVLDLVPLYCQAMPANQRWSSGILTATLAGLSQMAQPAVVNFRREVM